MPVRVKPQTKQFANIDCRGTFDFPCCSLGYPADGAPGTRRACHQSQRRRGECRVRRACLFTSYLTAPIYNRQAFQYAAAAEEDGVKLTQRSFAYLFNASIAKVAWIHVCPFQRLTPATGGHHWGAGCSSSYGANIRQRRPGWIGISPHNTDSHVPLDSFCSECAPPAGNRQHRSVAVLS